MTLDDNCFVDRRMNAMAGWQAGWLTNANLEEMDEVRDLDGRNADYQFRYSIYGLLSCIPTVEISASSL